MFNFKIAKPKIKFLIINLEKKKKLFSCSDC